MIDDGSAQQYRGNIHVHVHRCTCTVVRSTVHVVVGYLDTVLMCAPILHVV